MSRKKHNVSYIKPDEPKFLRELKEQVGYKEGPTIDTKVQNIVLRYYRLDINNCVRRNVIINSHLNDSLKQREILPQDSDDEREEPIEEQPIVVVLNSGDLTAEEADAFIKKKEEEEANTPADLSKRVIFKKNKKDTAESDAADKPAKKKIKKSKQEKAVLSFNDNDDNYL
ncbi:uncharacterized protein KIAA1143 homolog isoform X1 [Nomia melanderi]|uniref:uncharacterized protein KIAA1143 homolog isoform X1 n=1 Tax=Nomia melanderi TaxID=2448451 RepID=UPI003FCC9A34